MRAGAQQLNAEVHQIRRTDELEHDEQPLRRAKHRAQAERRQHRVAYQADAHARRGGHAGAGTCAIERDITRIMSRPGVAIRNSDATMNNSHDTSIITRVLVPPQAQRRDAATPASSSRHPRRSRCR